MLYFKPAFNKSEKNTFIKLIVIINLGENSGAFAIFYQNLGSGSVVRPIMLAFRT